MKVLSSIIEQLSTTPIPASWPPETYMLAYSTGHHSAAKADEVPGLAVFTSKLEASEFSSHVHNAPSTEFEIVPCSFLIAKELAEAKGLSLLILFDSSEEGSRVYAL